MDLEEYRQLAMRTCSIADNKKDMMIHGTCGYMCEVEELEEAFLFDNSIEHTIKELGDVVWMISEIVTSVDRHGSIDAMVHAFELCKGPLDAVAELRKIGVMLCEIIQKSYQGHGIDADAVNKLCHKAYTYVDWFCYFRGVELDTVLTTNIEKLKKRYPDGFDPERSLHRAEGDI